VANTLSINIIAEIKEAVKSIEEFSKVTSDELKKTNSSIKALEVGLKGIGVGLIAAFGSHLVAEFVKEAIEAEDAINKLSNTLKLTGSFSKEAVHNFESLAKEMLQLTGVNDEAVLAQISFIKSLGATNKEAEKVVRVAADLSVALGTDLATAVDQLTATYSGNIRGLGRQFKELKNFSDAQLQAGAAVDFLAKKLDGFAASNAKNLGTQLQVLGQNFNNLKEAIGRIFTGNTFVGAVELINKAILALTESIKSLLSGHLDPLAQTVIKVASAFSAFFIISKLPGLFSAVSASMALLNAEFLAFKATSGFSFSGLITSVKAFTASINAAKIAVNLLKASATLGLTILIDQLVTAQVEAKSFSDGFSLFFNKIKRVFLDVFGVIIQTIATTFEYLGKIPGASQFKDLSRGFNNLASKIADTSYESKQFSETYKETGEVIKHANNEAADSAKGLGQILEEQLQRARDFLNNLKKDIPGLKVEFLQTDYKKNLKEAEKAFKILNTKKEEADKIRLFLEEKLQKDIVKANREAVEEQIKEFEKLSSVLKGGDIKEFAKAFNKNPIEGSIALGLDVTNFAAQGQKGAIELAKNLIKTLGKALGPFFESIAPAAGQIFEVFAQGKEKVNELITSFIQGIPVIIQNVIASIPQLLITIFSNLGSLVTNLITQAIPQAIQEFINRLPEIVNALAQSMVQVGVALAAQAPLIASKLAISLTAQSPTIARSIIVEMVRNIPLFVSEAGKELAKSVKDALAGISGVTGIGGGSKGIGSLFAGIGTGGISKVFGFADGIGEIPSGFPRDSFAAGLTSGERVVDADSNNSLKKFLSAFEQGRLNSNQPLTINIQVGEAQLAQTILNLNRQGFRLS